MYAETCPGVKLDSVATQWFGVLNTTPDKNFVHWLYWVLPVYVVKGHKSIAWPFKMDAVHMHLPYPFIYLLGPMSKLPDCLC